MDKTVKQTRKVQESEQLFIAALRGSESGLDASQSLALMPLSNELKNIAVKRALAGESLSSIGYRYSWLNSTESSLIRLGEMTGLPQNSYRLLADIYGQFHQHFLMLRSELAYPVILMSLVLLLDLVIGSVRMSVGAGDVSVTSVVSLFCWIIFLRKVFHFFKYKRIQAYSKWWLNLLDWQSRSHLFGRLADRDLLQLFALMVHSGQDYQSALNKVGSIMGRAWRPRCMDAAKRIGSGGGLVNALRDSHLVMSPSVLSALRAADHSGRLLPELDRLLAELSQELADDWQFYLSTIAKLAYFIALLIVGSLAF